MVKIFLRVVVCIGFLVSCVQLTLPSMLYKLGSKNFVLQSSSLIKGCWPARYATSSSLSFMRGVSLFGQPLDIGVDYAQTLFAVFTGELNRDGVTRLNEAKYTLSYERSSRAASSEGMKEFRGVEKNVRKPLFSLLATKAAIVNLFYCLSVYFIPFNRVTLYKTPLSVPISEVFSSCFIHREGKGLVRLAYVCKNMGLCPTLNPAILIRAPLSTMPGLLLCLLERNAVFQQGGA